MSYVNVLLRESRMVYRKSCIGIGGRRNSTNNYAELLGVLEKSALPETRYQASIQRSRDKQAFDVVCHIRPILAVARLDYKSS